jgi:hypothetical protein
MWYNIIIILKSETNEYVAEVIRYSFKTGARPKTIEENLTNA